jgi:FKBP-type peptidyl-prolyl cis-trans isomerase 2
VTDSAVLEVGPGAVVRLEYSLYDAAGELFEAPGSDEALELIVGVGQAPELIERAIEGLSLGQSRRVDLAPSEAFGARDEDAIVVVARGDLPDDAALGDELEGEGEDGQTVFLRVVELDAEHAQLDANHPLAGQSIGLELRVVGLRAASAGEVQAARAALDAEDGSAPDVAVSRLWQRERLPSPGSE